MKEGEVREIHDVREGLVMVATDRISAFGVILEDRITDKSTVLTQLSRFQFEYTRDIMPNHMINTDTVDMPELFRTPKFERRSMLYKKLIMLPIEYIVHGYIMGSGWESYKKNGAVYDIQLPTDLQESEQLPEPIFTLSTKVEIGDHDENIDFARYVEVLREAFPDRGREYAKIIRDKTLALCRLYADHAKTRSVITVDTKFEFGLNEAGEAVLADGILTPDPSRFWSLKGYAPGKSQPSFNERFVRDWLKASPDSDYELLQDIIGETIAKYKEAYAMPTGKELD